MARFALTELVGGRVLTIDGLDASDVEECGGGLPLAAPGGPDHRGGEVVVAAMLSHELVHSEPGSTWTRFGTEGSDPGQFRAPAAAAFRGSGGFLVLDSGNRRVVAVDDLAGSGWTSYPSSDEAPPAGSGPYIDPRGLAVDSADRIWVADPGAGLLTRMDDIQGGGWTEIDLPAGGRPPRPYGLCAYADGVAVVDTGNSLLVVLDHAGTVTATCGLPPGAWLAPTFVTAVGPDLVVADVRANELRMLAPTGDTFTVTGSLWGSPPHELTPVFDSLGGVG
jgi:hypothetical protein